MEILPKLKGSVLNFTEKDAVRHDMVTRIVKAYNKRDRKLKDFKDNMKLKILKPLRVNEESREKPKALPLHITGLLMV